MSNVSTNFSGKWTRNAAGNIIHAMSSIVFLLLDLVDAILCIVYKILDEFFEGNNASKCYCHHNVRSISIGEDEAEVSESLYGRRNVFRQLGILGLKRKREVEADDKKDGGILGNRWSDCGCESCISWQNNDDQRLYVVTKDPSQATIHDSGGKPSENVIFIHGFLSSSSIWTETVFPNLSETINHNYKLFAIDLLGFGRSPKPRDCLYTLKDHLEMIEKSVIHPFHLNSFHLVAHSMGCIIALALAAKYPNSVKSITLIAPPYVVSSKDKASLTALRRFAEKRLWPPLLFGSSVMSWDLHFKIVDMTRHTHHSAWHTMHNVICGGAKFIEEYLEILKESDVRINLIHGDRDEVVPLECSNNIKLKIPVAEVNIIRNADHTSVILGREKYITQDLERIWASSTTIYLASSVDRYAIQMT